jgi:hypothetical protein
MRLWDLIRNDMEGGHSMILDREIKWIDFSFLTVRAG